MSTRPECFIGQALVRRGEAIPSGLLRCDGQWDPHHLIRRNRLKRELADEVAELAIDDERNIVTTCRRHHELVERALVKLFRDDLPEDIERFAADFALQGWLDRYYPVGWRAA